MERVEGAGEGFVVVDPAVRTRVRTQLPMPGVTTLRHAHPVVGHHSFDHAEGSLQGLWGELLGAGQLKEGWRWQVPFDPRGGDSKCFHADLHSEQLSGRLTISKDLAGPEETEDICDGQNLLGEQIVLDDVLGAVRTVDCVVRAQRRLVGRV